MKTNVKVVHRLILVQKKVNAGKERANDYLVEQEKLRVLANNKREHSRVIAMPFPRRPTQDYNRRRKPAPARVGPPEPARARVTLLWPAWARLSPPGRARSCPAEPASSLPIPFEPARARPCPPTPAQAPPSPPESGRARLKPFGKPSSPLYPRCCKVYKKKFASKTAARSWEAAPALAKVNTSSLDFDR